MVIMDYNSRSYIDSTVFAFHVAPKDEKHRTSAISKMRRLSMRAILQDQMV